MYAQEAAWVAVPNFSPFGPGGACGRPGLAVGAVRVRAGLGASLLGARSGWASMRRLRLLRQQRARRPRGARAWDMASSVRRLRGGQARPGGAGGALRHESGSCYLGGTSCSPLHALSLRPRMIAS